ncbi:MAG: hypothetical protein V7767_11230 [Leeuwenhoekiella sp.]
MTITEEENGKNKNAEFEKDFKIVPDFLSFVAFEISEKRNINFEYTSSLSSVYIDPIYPPPKFI